MPTAHEHERRAREICNVVVLTSEARDTEGAETLVESHSERREARWPKTNATSPWPTSEETSEASERRRRGGRMPTAHERERTAREICNVAVLTSEARDTDGAEALDRASQIKIE